MGNLNQTQEDAFDMSLKINNRSKAAMRQKSLDYDSVNVRREYNSISKYKTPRKGFDQRYLDIVENG